MLETHIYIQTDTTSQKVSKKQYGYVLEAKMDGESKTRDGYGTVTGTYHQTVLTAIIAAFGRFNQGCEIYLHTEDEFVLNMMEICLETWAEGEFRTTKGKPVANHEEWAEVWRLSQKHLILPVTGKHAYANWLETEMKKQEVAPVQKLGSF